MTKIAIMLLLLSSPAAAAQDCADADAADACSAGTKTLSPFVAASIGERLPPPALPGGKKAALREAPARPGEAAAEIVSKKREADPEAAPPREPEQEPEDEVPAEDGAAGGFSVKNPFWLVFMGAMLAGLYIYLGGDARKGGKK